MHIMLMGSKKEVAVVVLIFFEHIVVSHESKIKLLKEKREYTDK